MTDDERDAAKRRILTLVAEGTLSPSDAADQLAALDAPTGTGADGDAGDAEVDEFDLEGPDPTWETAPPPRPRSGSGPVRAVRVTSTARSVVIIGDPDVREAVAQGRRYEQRYDGDTLVISSDIDFDDPDGFGAFRVNHIPGGHRRIVIDGRRGINQARQLVRDTLVIRMNPTLALGAEIAAGSLSVTGVRGPVKANVAAGSMKIDDFEGPISVDVAAGSFKGNGRLDHGQSKINCAMGSVKLDLDESSSVRIIADASLGSVKLPGRPFKAEKGSFGMTENQETVVGAGHGELRVETSMGSVKITVVD